MGEAEERKRQEKAGEKKKEKGGSVQDDADATKAAGGDEQGSGAATQASAQGPAEAPSSPAHGAAALVEGAQSKAEASATEPDAAVQQKAILAIFHVLKELSGATLATFESLEAELAKVLANELPKVGVKEAALRSEATRVLEHTKKLIEHEKQQRAAGEARSVG